GGSHTLNSSGSAYNNTSITGCTDSGAGCHGAAPANYQAIHPNSGCLAGPCHTAVNHNDVAFNDPNTCQNCHGGGAVNYDHAPDVAALADSAPGGHYSEATHTATPATAVSAGGTYSATCSTCHNPVSATGIDGLYNQHQGLDTLGSTTCADCHNKNVAIQAIVTDSTRTDTCAACHTAAVLPTMAQHGTTAPQVVGTEAQGFASCATIGCHATTDLHALHKSNASGNANGCTMAGCHDSAKQGFKPTATSCGIGGDCHATDPHSPVAHITQASAECIDCHESGGDLKSVHPGGCATCHNNPSYPTLPAGKLECVSCHTTGVVGTHDYTGENHYSPSLHTGNDGPSAGALSCSDCHALGLGDEHAVVLEQRDLSADGTVTCVECHNEPYAKQVVDSNWSLNSQGGAYGDMSHECADCHNVDGLGDRHDARESKHAAIDNPSCFNNTYCHTSDSNPRNPGGDLEHIHENAVDSEGRMGCLVCHSNGADTAMPGASCGTDGTCHTDKAAGNHGAATVHAFSAGSDYSNTTATGCTNSGAGCHGNDYTRDNFASYHPNTGCASGACHTSPSKATYSGNHECVSCHNGNYAGAPDVVDLTGASPDGHYNETTHTPAGMNTSINAGGTQSATCNDCHNGTSATTVDQLFAQHQGIGAVASPSVVTTTFTDGFESGFSTPTVWTSADYQAYSSGSTSLFSEGFTSATFATGWTATSFTSVNTQNHAGLTGTYAAYATRTSGTGGSARVLNRSTGFNTSGGSGTLTFWQYGTGTVGSNTGFTVDTYNGTTLVSSFAFPTATSAGWVQRTITLPNSTNARFVFNLTQHATVSQTVWIDDVQVTAGSGTARPEAGWSVQTATKHSGTSGARAIGADATARYVTKTGISNTGADSVTLNYSINYASLEVADSLAVQTYNGTSWTTAKTYTLTGGSLAWTDEQITGLPATTTGVRFAFKGDTADDLVYVDDVSVQKVVNGSSTAGTSVTCSECHNANAKTVSLVSGAVAWNDRCDACHNSTDMPAAAANHLTSVPAVTGSSTQGCATTGAGCHATNDLHAIHKGNGGAADPTCGDCHNYGAQAAKPTGTTCGVGGSCHNAATYTATDHAKTGNDSLHTATGMTTTLDGTTYNTGGGNTCSDCHSSGLRSAHTTVTATLDSGHTPWVAPFCADCHNSTNAEANSVTTIKTNSWSAQTCDQCHVTNGNGKHTTYTPAAHTATTGTNTCTGAGCHATLDVRTLHNKINVGCTLAGTDSFGVGGACHDLDKKMTAPLSCGTGTTGCHTSHAAGNHGPDHNAAQILGAPVGTTGQTYGLGTNVGCFMAGANTGCHFQDLRREHGSTAYLTAQGVAGTERTMNGARGSSTDGCTVCHATGMGTAGAYAARTAISTAITNGDYRCTSCHFEATDAAGTTGVQAPHKSTEKLANAPLGTTAEWAAAAIAQGGGHNSFGAKKFPKTGAIAYGTPINGVTMTGSFGNMAGTWASGWTQASDVTCTSVGCHNRTTAPNGPQGASVPWYWNNGTAVTGTIATHWYTNSTGSSAVPSATGCQNCHATLSSVHRSEHNIACQGCHIRIPHAWKRPRLLRRNIAAGGTTTEPVDGLPYSDPTVVGLEGYKVVAGTTSFSTEANCNDNCASTRHSATAPYWP
ncbi:MAG: hypothetical protein WCI74_01335, partial [Actinomycetes bacterium]